MAANNRLSILVALENSDAGLRRALNLVERSLRELAASAKTAREKAAGSGSGTAVGGGADFAVDGSG